MECTTCEFIILYGMYYLRSYYISNVLPVKLLYMECTTCEVITYGMYYL